MSQRLIGIDKDGTTWRIAVLQTEKGRTRLLGVGEHPAGEGGSLRATLAGLLGTALQPGDRLCMALPAHSCWLRQLQFPFAERRAITAALPLELAGQLPLPLEECEVVSLDPVVDPTGALLLAAAARRSTLAEALTPFEESGVPLQTLDLLPFAASSGGATLFPRPTLLLLAQSAETVLLRLESGRLLDWRVLPHAGTLSPAELAARVQQTLGTLRYGSGTEELLLAGSGAGMELQEALRTAGCPAELARPLLDGQPVAATDLVPVLLALRAGRNGANFRRGVFAQRGELAPFRRRLWLGAVLLGLTLLTAGTSAFLGYRYRAQRADALKAEMTQIYRELVPGQGAVVDPLLQLQGKLVELERSARLGGADRAHAPLAVLREVSRLTPGDLLVDLRDFSWSPDEVRLEGTTSSFDTAGRLARLLEQSPLFTAVRLTDTRALADGGRVEFRLTLSLHQLQEQRR